MKLNFSARRLAVSIVVFPLLALLLYGGVSYMFFTHAQKGDVELELENLMDIEKQRLSGKVESLTQLISYYDTISSDNIKDDVKTAVDITSNIANNIYNRYKGVKYDHEIKNIILSSLKDIDFENSIDNYFLLTLNGNALIHSDESKRGINIINIKDMYGKFIVKEFGEVIKDSGEGFVDYWSLSKVDRKTPLYNIAYVKKLDCYDWYIGAGEYLESLNDLTKKNIIKYITSNFNLENGDLFLFDVDNNTIFSSDEKNSMNFTSLESLGFHSDNTLMYYKSHIPERDWYIVATRSLEEIRESIKKRKEINDAKREDDIRTNVYVLAASLFISILLSLFLSLLIRKRLKSYEGQVSQSKEKLIFQSKQALIGELFSMIAHQWRQPINKIASIVALLRFDLESDEVNKKEIDKSCEEIENSIEFMSETIDDFRTFYKPTTKTQMVNLKALIGRSVIFLKSTIVKNDIKVIQDLEDIKVELYRNEFLQVMLNLVKNAIDAIGERGAVVIKLYRDERGKIIIYVENSGKSIDDKLISKVFDPYFTTKEDSMGLGLYMTKMIVEKHMSGSISVKAVRDGTRFTIEL